MKYIYDLTTVELKKFLDSSVDVHKIIDILEKPGVTTFDGYVDIERFARWFAYDLEEYISADEGTAEYDIAWEDIFYQGENIAEAINDYLDIDE
jgi:hypothetical protein